MEYDQALLLSPKRAQCPAQKDRLWIKSKELPGLYLEIKPTERRSWFGYLLSDGKQLRKKLADANLVTYTEAKDLYRQWVNAKTLIDSQPQGYEAPVLMTIEEAFFVYYSEHVYLNTARPKETLAGYHRYWGAIKSGYVITLKGDQVTRWMTLLATQFGKETANKQLNTLRACINYVADRELVSLHRNPFKLVKRFRSFKRDGHLKKGQEYDRTMELLDKCTSQAAAIIKLLLWCGQRKGNVLAMRWDEIDFGASSWTIPGRSYKARKTHTAAISARAMAIIDAQPRISPFVFPSKRSRSGHRENLEHVWHEVRKEAELKGLTLHGLRHTVGTWLAQANTNGFVIQKTLGHANIATTQRYTEMDISDARAGLESIQLGL